MLKHTIHISNPVHLSLHNHQLVIRNKETEEKSTIAIEDIATIILADRQTTLSAAILSRCITAGISIISCDEKFMPIGMFLCLDGHSQQQNITTAQLDSSLPLRKQIWQSTISAKVKNQAAVLKAFGQQFKLLEKLSSSVKSGDSTGIEAQSARYYWQQYFGFVNAHHGINQATYRKREGYPPNNWLNYGYTILRAMVARSLTGSGLLPVQGIHHHNKYNAYCLADDIMEPYRPMVDKMVIGLCLENELVIDIPQAVKNVLLQLPTMDCALEGKKYTVYSAIERSTASLAQSFTNKENKILYPNII